MSCDTVIVCVPKVPDELVSQPLVGQSLSSPSLGYLSTSLCQSMQDGSLCFGALYCVQCNRTFASLAWSCGTGLTPGKRDFHILCLFFSLWATQWMGTGMSGRAGVPVLRPAPTVPSSERGSATDLPMGEQSARGTGWRPEIAS